MTGLPQAPGDVSVASLILLTAAPRGRGTSASQHCYAGVASVLPPPEVELTHTHSMSSLSLATAKHLRNVVPYTIIPFEKEGIQGNAEKFIDTTYASVFVPSIIAHTDQKKK